MDGFYQAYTHQCARSYNIGFWMKWTGYIELFTLLNGGNATLTLTRGTCVCFISNRHCIQYHLFYGAECFHRVRLSVKLKS